MHKILAFSVMIAFLATPVVTDAQAGEKYRGKTYTKYYKSKSKRTRVSRNSRRVGGYSYSYRDTLPSVPLPNGNFGPFDTGFFFDSDVRPMNNAPYLY